MLARSLALLALALLAPLAAATRKYETNLQEGELPEGKLDYLGHFGIPDGQCSGELDLSHLRVCVPAPSHQYGGPNGIRTLKATIEDNKEPADIVFGSVNNQQFPGKLNNIVVYREGDCKGKVHLKVYYVCDSLTPHKVKINGAAIIPPAKSMRRYNGNDNINIDSRFS